VKRDLKTLQDSKSRMRVWAHQDSRNITSFRRVPSGKTSCIDSTPVAQATAQP
jgi:hypothetical protein